MFSSVTSLSSKALLALVASLTLTASPAFANNANSPLGTNTNELSDEDSSIPFVDLFRVALPFEKAKPWLTKGNLQYDRNGWPVNLNGGRAGTRFLANLPGASIPQGLYTVLYEGEGKLQYGNDAKLVDQGQGYDRIQIQAGADNTLNATLYIIESNPRNPVRNIKIMMPGGICASNPFRHVNAANQCRGDYQSFVDHHDSILFNPDYLEYLRPFKSIRFMNMSGIVGNEIRSWNQRNTVEKATWGGYEGDRGAPLEVMVALANAVNADPWFTLPYNADDDFVRRYAQYVKQHLKPNLRPHIEYSNETWNFIFKSGNHVRKLGMQHKLDSNMNRAGYRYYSQRSVEIFRIWEQVYGGTNRLVRILSGWTPNYEVTEIILSHKDAYKHADAFAVGPYFFGEHESIPVVRNLQDVFNLMTDDTFRYSINNVLTYVKKQKEIADKYGVRLMAYEGGQALVDFHTRRDDQHPNPLLYQANRHPRMGQFYTQFLNGWKATRSDLFMHYSTPRTYRKYGSFGSKEYIRQPLNQAPKHQAILNFIRQNPKWF